MEPEFFGIEGIVDEDRAYQGSRFAEVRDALFANPYQKVWGRAGEPPLPVYEVTVGSVLRGVLPFGGPHLFRKATERAVDSHADLRWGPDRKGYRRLLQKRQPGIGDRTLFHLLHGDAARPRALAGAGGEALSYHRRESCRAAQHR